MVPKGRGGGTGGDTRQTRLLTVRSEGACPTRSRAIVFLGWGIGYFWVCHEAGRGAKRVWASHALSPGGQETLTAGEIRKTVM